MDDYYELYTDTSLSACGELAPFEQLPAELQVRTPDGLVVGKYKLVTE